LKNKIANSFYTVETCLYIGPLGKNITQVTKIFASFNVSGVAQWHIYRVFCALEKEIFLRLRQPKQWSLNVKKQVQKA